MTQSLGILIVEDEMLLVMDLEALIEESGHAVIAEAASLPEVERLPNDLAPQLAFVDMQLAEGSNGVDVCAVIRRRWPDALIVFVTANATQLPEDFHGAHGAIAKPFSQAGVISAINYLSEGVFDPPPHMARPASLIGSARLERQWMASRA